MTYLLRSRSDHNIVSARKPDWEAEHPYTGETGKTTMEIVHAWQDGSRILLPEEMPKRLVAERSRKTWPDAFMSVNQLLIVKEPVRTILERLDPGLHQFFPIRFETRRGKEVQGPWFILIVMADQDSIDVEKSNVLINPRFPDTLCSAGIAKPGQLFVDPSRQSEVHLWREKRFKMHLWASDRIVAEMESAGLKFFKSHLKATDI